MSPDVALIDRPRLPRQMAVAELEASRRRLLNDIEDMEITVRQVGPHLGNQCRAVVELLYVALRHVERLRAEVERGEHDGDLASGQWVRPVESRLLAESKREPWVILNTRAAE